MRTYRMKYSMKPKEQIYVKSYGYLSFAKNMSKNLIINYGKKSSWHYQKVGKRWTQDYCKKSTLKNSRKNWDLVENEIKDIITTAAS